MYLMKAVVSTRVPVGGDGIGPNWYHHHGAKMTVAHRGRNLLVIAGSVAKIHITPCEGVAGEWSVNWQVKSAQSSVAGSVIFQTEELRGAFGLSNETGKDGDWIIERFGGDSAQAGKYIRYKRFLNIPCPGTGDDGDPNISINLDDEIKLAIRQLMS